MVENPFDCEGEVKALIVHSDSEEIVEQKGRCIDRFICFQPSKFMNSEWNDPAGKYWAPPTGLVTVIFQVRRFDVGPRVD